MPRFSTALVLRLLLYVAVLPWIEVCLREPNYAVREYWLGFAGLLLAAGILLRFGRAWLARPWVRGAELVLWNGVATFLLAEAVVRATLALGVGPVWFDPSPDSVRYRLDPTRPYLGTRPNSQGFYDEEFGPKRPDVLRVVALGDSYSVGMVPYAESYLTLVDEALGEGIEVLNLGVVHTSVREYLQVLESDGLALAPDLVLVGIFIGNDIQPDEPVGLLSGHGSKLVLLARSAAAVVGQRARFQTSMELDGMFRIEADGTRVERPLLPQEEYDARLWKHLRRNFRPATSTRMKRAWADVERALDDLVATCRAHGIPIVATIAPDEIQVDRPLYDRLLAAHGAPPASFDLDFPTRRIRGMLDELGVPYLEFTEAIRAAERKARAHHLRGLHWNRHGNAAAAAALAPWLARQVETLTATSPRR